MNIIRKHVKNICAIIDIQTVESEITLAECHKRFLLLFEITKQRNENVKWSLLSLFIH